MKDDYKDRRYHEENEEDIGEAFAGVVIFAIIICVLIYIF